MQYIHCRLDDLSIDNKKSKLVDENYIIIQTLFRLIMWNDFCKNSFLWLITGLAAKSKTTDVTYGAGTITLPEYMSSPAVFSGFVFFDF